MNKSSSDSAPAGDDERRILRFQRPGSAPVPLPRQEHPPVADGVADRVADLVRFEQGQETKQEYQRRMAINAVGFLFVLALVGAAIWLADTMATMRKNQDCVLSGRVGCTKVDFTPTAR